MAESEQALYPPRFTRVEVDGQKVVTDHVQPAGLSTPEQLVPVPGIRVLTLEDGTVLHACNDCQFVSNPELKMTTLGQVRQHRKAHHPALSRGGRTKVTPEEADVIGVPAGRRLPYPSADALGRSLLEILELAERIDQWEEAFAGQEEVIRGLRETTAEAVQRAATAEKELKAMRRKTASLARTLGMTVTED